MEINICSPFNLRLSIQEIDDVLPSINFNIYVKAHQFNHEFIYNGNTWISRCAFDKFILSLKNNENICPLENVDGWFNFKIFKKENDTYLYWDAKRIGVAGDQIHCHFSTSISIEDLYKIKYEFQNFYKWWAENT